jgi:cobaltochelatase CobT
MKSTSLKTALPMIMRYLSDDIGVEIVWGGNQAHTWDGVLYLPNLKDEPGVELLALGYGAHESAHVKFSTQSVYEMASQEPPFVVKFMNLLEDVRIEGLMHAKHPSTRPWLAHTVKTVLGGPVDYQGLSEAVVLHNSALLIGRHRLLGQPLQAESEAAQKELRKTFGPGRSTKIMALLGKIPACADTQGVYELTHQILDVLDDEEPEDQQPKDPPGDAGDKSDGSQGKDSKQESGQPDKGDPEQPGEGDGQQAGGKDGSEAGGSPASKPTDPGAEGSGKSSGTGSGSDASSPASAGDKQGDGQSLKQKVLSAGSDELDDLKSDLGESVAKILNKNIDQASSSTPASILRHAIGNERLCQASAANGRAASMGMRQVLLGLIQGSRNVRPVFRKTGSSVDSSRVARVAVGETRIFRKTEPVQRVNAAFQILLDASSSMDSKVLVAGGPAVRKAGEKVNETYKPAVRIAEEAVLAVLNGLEGLQGVTSGAMVFPRSGVKGSSVSVGVLKRHNQTLSRAIQENRFGVLASGGTPLAEAIWPAAGDLLSAKGERKVLAVITDGDPSNSTSAAEMVRRCRSSGIEVFAIAFGDANREKLTQVFGPDSWTYLADITQLRAGLSNLVKNVLTKKAA